MAGSETLRLILVVFVSYLFGSLPTAYLVAKRRGMNIFEVGSGNMGATNVIRAVGLGWGLLVWFFDSLKGVLAILIARALVPDDENLATAVSATVAVIGHNWSVFAMLLTGTLRGGKGAAIWFGTMILMAPVQVFVGMLMLGGFIIALTRYVSLAVLAMCGLSTLWVIVLISQRQSPVEYALYFLIVSIMILFRFRENIHRLLTGTERRLGETA